MSTVEELQEQIGELDIQIVEFEKELAYLRRNRRNLKRRIYRKSDAQKEYLRNYHRNYSKKPHRQEYMKKWKEENKDKISGYNTNRKGQSVSS